MSHLDVRYLNAYVGNRTPGKAVNRMLRLRQGWETLDGRPHFAGWSESKQVMGLLGARSNYRLYRAVGTSEQRRGVMDCAISVRRDLDILATATVRISELVPTDSRFAPDRWALMVAADVPDVGAVAYIVTHPNAQVQGRSAGMPRVREYAEGMASLDRLIGWCSREGFQVVLAGDLNYSRSGPQDPWSPYGVLKRHDMHVVAERHIDIIAAASSLTRAMGLPTSPRGAVRVPKEHTGSDHYGLEVRLARGSAT